MPSEDLVENDHDYTVTNMPNSLTFLSENVVVYISGYVVKFVMKKIKCIPCHMSSETISTSSIDYFMLLNVKNNGGLKRPSQDVVAICKQIEICIRNVLHVTENNVDSVKTS